MFRELGEIASDCFSVSRYKLSTLCVKAEKMLASIIGVAAEKLMPYSFGGTARLFRNSRQISFPNLGREKTALFLSVSDTDRSLDKLLTLFYTQSIQSLICEADQSSGHRLAVPVRLILDDFASFASVIPDFDKTISVIRSREISVSVIVQSLSQLEGLYGHARAMTIVNNCDHHLYPGGGDVATARYFSIKANQSVHSILDMPLDSAYLFTRGQAAQKVRKFDIATHARYHALPEYRAALWNAARERSKKSPNLDTEQEVDAPNLI